MAQFARPNSDITENGWTVIPLWGKIDEASASDSDFISSQDNTNNAYVAGLSTVNDPNVGTGHIVRYRYRKDASGGHSINAQVELRQGTTIIATGTLHTGISTTWTAGSFTLSESEANSITDYTDLRLYLRRLGDTGGAPGNRRKAEYSWAELEVPDPVYEPPTKTFDFVGQVPLINAADILAPWVEKDDAAGSTIDITTTALNGKTPKAAIVLIMKGAGANTGTLTHSVGYVTGSSEQFCNFSKSVPGATSDEKTGAFNDACGFFDDGTNQLYVKLNSFITNGIRLNRTNSGSDPSGATYLVKFFAGDDVNDAEVVTHTITGAVDSAQAIPTTVIESNVAIMSSYRTAQAATTSPTYINDTQKHIGFMVDDGAGGVDMWSRWAWYANGVTTSSANSATQTDRIARARDSASGDWTLEGNSFGNQVINTTLRNTAPASGEGNVVMLVLRLNTDDLYVANNTTAASATTKSFTGPGFRPYWMIRSGTRRTGALETGNGVGGPSSSNEGFSIAFNADEALDGSTNPLTHAGAVAWWHGDHGITSGGEVGVNIRDSYEILHTDNESFLNANWSGNIDSWDATGWTDDYDVATSANNFGTLAIGLNKIPPPQVVNPPTKTFDWVGQVPTIDVGAGGTVVVVGHRGISIDTSEQIVIGLGIIPPVKTIDFVGETPEPIVSIPTLQIDVAGQAPVLDLAIIPPTKAIDFVGNDPAVIEPQADPLLIDVAGQVPTISIGIRVMVPVKAINFVNSDPFPATHNPQTELVIDVAGQVPDVGPVITPPTLAIDVAGQVVDVGPVLAVPVKTIDFVGEAPSEVFSSIPEAQIDWVGQTPSIVVGINVAIPLKTIDFVGNIPGVIEPQADPLLIDFVGQVPTVTVAIIPPELTIDFVGETPVLDLGVIPPELTIDFVGQVPTIVTDEALVIPTLAIDFVGNIPGVIEPQAEPLSIDVAGQAPVIGLAVIPPTLAIDVAGIDPGVIQPQAEPLSINIQGQQPFFPVSVPTRSIDVAGQTPSLPIVPPELSIDWVGFAPAAAVSNNIRASPPTLSIDWVGYAPLAGVLGSINVLVPLRSFTIADLAPVVVLQTFASVQVDGFEVEYLVAVEAIEVAELITHEGFEIEALIGIEEVEVE